MDTESNTGNTTPVERCPLCGGCEFSWGELALPGLGALDPERVIVYKPDDQPSRPFWGGPGTTHRLRGRECLRCTNVQFFVYKAA